MVLLARTCHVGYPPNFQYFPYCWGRKCPITFSACASKILGRARILIRNKHKSPDFSDSNENRLVHLNLHPSGLSLDAHDLTIQNCNLLWLFAFMSRTPSLPVEGCVSDFSHESGMAPPEAPQGPQAEAVPSGPPLLEDLGAIWASRTQIYTQSQGKGPQEPLPEAGDEPGSGWPKGAQGAEPKRGGDGPVMGPDLGFGSTEVDFGPPVMGRGRPEPKSDTMGDTVAMGPIWTQGKQWTRPSREGAQSQIAKVTNRIPQSMPLYLPKQFVQVPPVRKRKTFQHPFLRKGRLRHNWWTCPPLWDKKAEKTPPKVHATPPFWRAKTHFRGKAPLICTPFRILCKNPHWVLFFRLQRLQIPPVRGFLETLGTKISRLWKILPMRGIKFHLQTKVA